MRKFSALPQLWGGMTDYGSITQDRTGACVRVCVCVHTHHHMVNV